MNSSGTAGRSATTPASTVIPAGGQANWRRRWPLRWPLLLYLLLGWLLLSALPPAPFQIGVGMDPSWNYAVNMVQTKGLRYGPEITFTVGPLGYVATPDPAYAPLARVLLLRLLVWLVLAWGIVRIAARAGPAMALAAAFTLLPHNLLFQHYADAWQAAVMAVMLAAAFARCRSMADLGVAGAFTGITLLFKLNEGVTAFAVFLTLTGYSFWKHPGRRRAIAAIMATPVLILFGGMALLQGHPLDAIPYLRNSLDMIGGYSAAASAPGLIWQPGLALLYLGLIFAVPILFPARSYLEQASLVPATLVAFAAFKHGVVRQDGHFDLMTAKLAVAALFLMAASRAMPACRALGLLAVFGTLFSWVLVAQNQPWLYTGAWKRLQPAGIITRVSNLLHPQQEWELLGRLHRRGLAKLRLEPEFHRRIADRTIDAFPENIDVIRANGWNYRPRPSLQSSASYTRRLDEWNARHVASSRASDFALFMWYAIDGRHVFLQDPATFMALLDSYQPVLSNGRAILLERRPAPLRRAMIESGAVIVPWGRSIALPEAAPGEVIMAATEIRPSWYGRLRWFLFRAAPVSVFVTDGRGKEAFYRVVPANLASPAIYSPLPAGLAGFERLLKGQPPDPAETVKRLSWYTVNEVEYEPVIRMRWYRARLAQHGGN